MTRAQSSFALNHHHLPFKPTITSHHTTIGLNRLLKTMMLLDPARGGAVCHGAQVCRRSFLVPTLLNACGLSLKKFLELNARRGTKALFADDSNCPRISPPEERFVCTFA